MSGDAEDRLGRLCEELEAALTAGETLDLRALAVRFSVDEEHVRRAARALAALHEVLDDHDGDEVHAARVLPPPELPGDYEVLGELGRGGMGVVYRVHQRSLDRELAVKVLRPGDLVFGDAIARFEREARSLARLRHRHIVSVHEVGHAQGFVYFTMDYIAGETLAQRLARGPMTTAQVVRLVTQVARAIAYAHQKGVVHRDLKPQNILVDEHGDAFVVDFGLARDVDAAGDATRTGQLLGTPAYMSPEQALGDSERIGETSDVYALGAVLYECLAGVAPFAGLPLAQLMHAVIEREPVPLRKRQPHVPQDLAVICEQAMQKEPARRYATAQALVEDLERFSIGKEILARRRSELGRVVQFVRRHRRSVLTAVVPMVLMALFVWWLVLPGLVRARTAALATRMYAEGNTAGAAAAWLDVLGDVEAQGVDPSERAAAARALLDEAGRLYVRVEGSGPAADRLVAAAARILGNGPHLLWPPPVGAAAGVREEMLHQQARLQCLPTGEPGLLHADATRLRRELGDARSADAASMMFVGGLRTVLGAWPDGSLTAVQTLLQHGLALPPSFERTLREIARSRVPWAPVATVEDSQLADLVSIVRDPSRPMERRRSAAALFHRFGWLPSTVDVVPGDEGPEALYSERDLTWLASSWHDLHALDRIESHRRRVGVVIQRYAELEDPSRRTRWQLDHWLNAYTGVSSNSAAWSQWWLDHGDEDPRRWLSRALGVEVEPDDLTTAMLLQRLRRGEGDWRQLHRLLCLVAEDAVERPCERMSATQTLVAWERALGLVPDEGRQLRVATFFIDRTTGQPELLASHRQLVHVGDVAQWDLPARSLPIADAFVGGRMPAAVFDRRVRGSASVGWDGRSITLRGSSQLSIVMSGGTLRGLASAQNDDIPDGMVGLIESLQLTQPWGDRVSWFTLATLTGVEDRAWTQQDWREAVGRSIARLTGEPSDLLVAQAVAICIATLFPMPERLAELRQSHERIEALDMHQDYLSSSRLASLLAAGDEQVIGVEPTGACHDGDYRNAFFWSRLVLATDSERIRDHAFEHLRDTRVDVAFGRGLRRLRDRGVVLPQWLAEKLPTARSVYANFLWHSRWAVAGVLCNLLVGVLLVPFTWRSRAARRVAGPLLMVAGGLLSNWSLRLGGVEWNPLWLGTALHVLGCWALCWRASRSSLWLLASLWWTGTTIAHLAGLLTNPPTAWLIAIALVILLVPTRRAPSAH